MRHHHHHAREDHHRQHQAHFGRQFLERLYEHFHWHGMGRHQGESDGGRGRGYGGFGGHGGFGDDGDGFTRGRKVSSQDLQLLLLALLAEKPAHGYELIKALEARSNGFYTPSPGMVYPALTYLEELGQLNVTLEGNRKRYALADAGREFLAANRERADHLLERLDHIARKMDSVRRAYAGEGEAGEEGFAWVAELAQARRALKQAVYQCSTAGPQEQRRIAEVLLAAARAILQPNQE